MTSGKNEGLQLERHAGRWAGTFAVVAVAGLVLIAVGAFTTEHASERFFRSYLLNFMFFLGLALGGLFFVLISHLTRSGWSVVLRRLAEVLASGVLIMAPAALVLLFGMHELYEWTHTEAVAHDALLQHKQPWLNSGFFIGRMVFYFLVWNLIAWFFLRSSLRQDSSRDPELTIRMEKVAAPATIFFAMTITFASFDWIMSLYPHWYSTIFGVYFFAGSILATFSTITLIVTALQRAGKLRDVVSVEHYHDLGKLMFAFVVFWAYIAFSQYMLIWYANVPEETSWYGLRQTGSWTNLALVLLFGHFFAPFCFLMSRHIKRRRPLLVLGALWLVAMHWCDLFYLIMPESSPSGVSFHLFDFACFLLLGGLLFGYAFWRLGRAHIVPVGDPRLEESMGLESA